MYQLANNQEWDTDFFHSLMSDKHIISSKEAKLIREQLANAGALPHLDNHYDWAMLCISYCFTKELAYKPKELTSAPNAHGTDISSFTTCFQNYSRLWLVILSDALFRQQPEKAINKDDLYKFIADLWHTGALKLEEEWQRCQQYHQNDDVAARQQFLNNLAELAIQNSGISPISGSLKNPHDHSQDLENAPESCTTMGKRIVEALQNMGKGVKQIWFLGQGVRYDFYRVQFSSFVKLEQLHEQICSELGIATNDLRCERIEGAANTWHINILCDESAWQKPSKTEFQAALVQYKSSGKHFRLPVCIGIDERGQAIFQDFATAPHAIIGGETGSGKSVFMRSMLLSLFELSDKEQTEIAIVYCKQKTDFAAVEDYSNLWQQKIVSDPDEACEILAEFTAEMDNRYRLLDEHKAIDAAQLPEHLRFKRTILMIDELADLIDTNKEAENYLVRLAQKARAANIYLMLATQRPDAKTLSGRLRDNLTTKIALKVGKRQSSEIILGESGAELLASHGDHLVKWNGNTAQFLHGYFL